MLTLSQHKEKERMQTASKRAIDLVQLLLCNILFFNVLTHKSRQCSQDDFF